MAYNGNTFHPGYPAALQPVHHADSELAAATEAMQRAIAAATEQFRRRVSTQNQLSLNTPVFDYPLHHATMGERTSTDGSSSLTPQEELPTGEASMPDVPQLSQEPLPQRTTRRSSPPNGTRPETRIEIPPPPPPISPARRRSGSVGSDLYALRMPPRIGDNFMTGDSTPVLTGSTEGRNGLFSVAPSGNDITLPRSYRGSAATTVRNDMDNIRLTGSTTSLPGSVGSRGQTGTHIDPSDPLGKKNFRASYATTLRPDSFQPHHHIADGEPTPISIQIGRYTYIRQDAQPDLAAQLQQKLRGEKKMRKGNPAGPPLALWHEIFFVWLICAAQALMLSGIAQALVPAPIIGNSFGVSRPADLAWFSAAYALTSGTFVLPAGRLGDLFGHKKIFVIGFFWYAVWSLVAGFAPLVQQGGANGLIFFNFCRAMQGIGPALQVPNGQALLGRAYKPGPRKALVMSLFGAAAPFGFVVGGVMSSLFAQLATWPWAFWTLAAVCVALGIISIVVLPAPSGEEPKKNDGTSLWIRLDGPGMVLGVSGLVLFNFAWNQAPLVSWSTPYTYFLLIISIIFLVGFGYVERHAAYPLLPIAAMTAQTNFVLACTAAGWGCFSVWVFYSFQFLQVLREWPPLLSSACHSPGPVSGLIASLLVARYMMRLGPHWIMLLSMLAFLAGSLLMTTAPVSQTYWANTFVSVLIMPFGMDMSNPAATILLSNSVSREHQGIAASLVVTVVNYSISTALGFAATVETQVAANAGGDVLSGFRGAQYFGIGLGVLGVCVAGAFVLSTVNMKRRGGGNGPAPIVAGSGGVVGGGSASALVETGSASPNGGPPMMNEKKMMHNN